MPVGYIPTLIFQAYPPFEPVPAHLHPTPTNAHYPLVSVFGKPECVEKAKAAIAEILER